MQIIQDVWADGNVDLKEWNKSFSTQYAIVCVKDYLIVGFGDIDKISYKSDDVTKLVYINLTDQSFANKCIEEFVIENAARISDELLKKEGKISRLFIEYFYDGEAVDYAAKIGYQSDMQEIIDSYDGDLDAINCSGDYPMENRVECDNATLAVMLMCSDCNIRGDIFRNICNLMTEKIRNTVLDKLDKTEDFKFIDAEYD